MEDYTPDEKMISRLSDANAHWSRQMTNIIEDKKFASGNQWNDKARAQRQNKPTLTIDFTGTLIKKVTNPVRKNPFGMNVKNPSDQVTKLYQGLIRDIEYESMAEEVYECALENAVESGIGWVKIVTEWADDNSLDQVIRLKKVPDPTTILLDPHSEHIAGADATYAFELGYIDKLLAEEQYDLEGSPEHMAMYDTMYRGWNIPANSIPEMIYYCIEEEKSTKTWMKTGETYEGKPDIPPDESMVQGSRSISKKYVKVCKYVGGKKVDETRMDIPYIPIIPVYGDRVYDGDTWRGWAGMVRKVRDSQSMINYYASAEAQLVQSAPVSPWLIEEGQIEGYEDIWATANTDLHDHLPYRARNLGNTVIAPPQRVDNSAQTTHLTNARMMAVEDMQRASGIMGPALGEDDAPGQSGRAILLKQHATEMPNYHYIDNLKKTISQCGRVVIPLMNSVYDTERELTLRTERNEPMNIRGNITQYGAEKFDTEVTAGPMVQYEKEMTNATLLEIGRIAPDKLGLFADIILQNVQAPGTEEAVDRLRKSLPPELLPETDNAPDPQAMAALQEAQNTIQAQEATMEQYEAIIQTLQTQIIDSERDRKADIEKEAIKSETELAVAELESETKIEVERIKAGSKAESDNKKIIADARARLDEKVSEVTEDADESISEISDLTPENAMQLTEKPGGPVGGAFIEEPDASGETVESIDDLLEP